jgi:tetratricopeptide (TPR) repeat protein
MGRRSRLRNRSRTVPVPLPRPRLHLAALLLALLVLAAVVAVPTKPIGSDRLREWAAVADAYGAVRVAVIVLLAVLVVWLWRRWRIASMAARSGPVQVQPFVSATTEDVPVEEIEALFREALTSVQLSAPSKIPGASVPEDYVAEVRTSANTARTPLGLVVSAALSAWVTSAYRVTCTIRTDDLHGRKGLAVQIAGRQSGSAGVDMVWDTTWEQVARRAACYVAAHVIPRARLSRRPPWTSWRGVQLHPELFFHFQEGRRLAGLGRLEEALQNFDQALQRDPNNPYIRFEKATVQEELGLYVDALAGYVDIVGLERWHDRGLWKRYRELFGDDPTRRGGETRWWVRDNPPRWLERSPNGQAAIQLARFRIACSLAAADRLAEQWSRHMSTGATDQDRLRHEERDQVVHRLRPLLAAYFRTMCEAYGKDRSADDMVRLRGKLEQERDALRQVFQYAALNEGRVLAADYAWLRWRRWTWPLPPVSRAALGVLPVWGLLQLRYVEGLSRNSAVVELRGFAKLTDGQARRRDKQLTLPPDTGWPPDAAGVSRLLRGTRRKARVWRDWHGHYNVACAFAASMLSAAHKEDPAEGVTEDHAARHDAHIRYAVRHLERAVASADGQFAAGRAPWLRFGDQDLEDLRSTREFRTFIDRHFPSTVPLPRSAWNVRILVVTAHFTQLAARFADLRAAYWRDRRATVGSWQWRAALAEEPQWWDVLREYSRDYRHWPVRHRLVGHGLTSVFTTRIGRFDPALPELTDDLHWRTKVREHGLDGGSSSGTLDKVQAWLRHSKALGTLSEEVQHERDRALENLASKLSAPADLGGLLRKAAVRTGAPLPDEHVAALVTQLVVTWESVAAWMHGLSSRPGDGDQRTAEDELDRLRRLLATMP